jgi:hypothetical protein
MSPPALTSTSYSINTLLLQVFSKLIVHGRSFSQGDLVFMDEDSALFDRLAEKSSPVDSTFHEYVLPVAIEVLCRCDWCMRNCKPKRAIRFKKLDERYLFVRLLEYPSASWNGVLNSLKFKFMDPESDCPIRSCDKIPYSMHSYDAETIRRAIDSHHVREAEAEFETYNKNTRVGDEFYVPSALLLNTRLYN